MDPARDGATVRSRVGYVPERHHIYDWMTVAEVVRFVRPFYPAWNDRACADLIAKYALPPDKKVKQLSHGMGTKLSLVLALAHEPELLILDEPTTGLDPLVREEFVESIAALLRDLEKTVVFSSHILSDVERVVDTVAIMCDGNLLTMGPRDNLIQSTKRVDVTLRQTNGRPARPPQTIRDRIEGNVWTLTVGDWSDRVLSELKGAPNVESVCVNDMTLDDIFKDHIKGYSAA
jgi:ABC-2 type transport system ATP-binding protein